MQKSKVIAVAQQHLSSCCNMSIVELDNKLHTSLSSKMLEGIGEKCGVNNVPLVELYRIWPFQIWLELDLAGFRNSNPAGARARFSGELIFGSQNNMPDVTNGANNAVSCCKEAAQFSVSFVTVWQILTKFVKRQWIQYFFIGITLIKIANTPLDRSAPLVLSVINWTYCSCTSVCQIWHIRLEIRPEPDRTWPDFQKMTRFQICRSRSWYPVQLYQLVKWDVLSLVLWGMCKLSNDDILFSQRSDEPW